IPRSTTRTGNPPPATCGLPWKGACMPSPPTRDRWCMRNWQFLPEAKMVYNATRNTYEASLYLKQGYYNYHYVMLDNAANVAHTFLTEGDHFDTENFYTIYLYHRKPGNNYDQLIAVERITAPQPR
ncbi:MAG: hypothetical protein R6V49_04125, partial [Bacteroidales bacterium]